MFDKFIYEGLHFIMKWSGQINSWAWRRHAKILRSKQSKELKRVRKTSRKLRISRGVKKKTMTPEQALGMLFVGIVALSIGSGIVFIILRKVYREMHRSKKRFDDLE
jgi:hypothetical protein